MSNTSSIIVKSDIQNMYNIYTDIKFIKKIFDITDNKNINNIDDNGSYNIIKTYNVNDIENMFNITPYIKENYLSKIKDLTFYLNIIQNIIHFSEKLLIIKYICTIDKPLFVKNVLSDQSTIYYVKITQNNNNKSLLNIQYHRKFIKTGDEELYNDHDIIHEENIDILTKNKDHDTIKLNPGLLIAANALIGEEVVNQYIIPFIYTIFDDFVNKILNKKIKSYFKKKKIEVYIKK